MYVVIVCTLERWAVYRYLKPVYVHPQDDTTTPVTTAYNNLHEKIIVSNQVHVVIMYDRNNLSWCTSYM